MHYFQTDKHNSSKSSNAPITYTFGSRQHPFYNMVCHWHTDYEILRILEGSFHLTVNMVEYSLTQGDCILIQSNMIHGGIPSDCIYESIQFNLPAILSNSSLEGSRLQLLSSNNHLLPTRLISQDDPATALIHTLFDCLHEEKPESLFFVQGYIIQLAALILEHGLTDSIPKADSHEAERIGLLKQVLSYIEQHFTEEITLDQLADIAGMNKRYFCRFFRKNTQMTPIHYVNYFRIEYAVALFHQGVLSTSQAAISCGFRDPGYFYKAFQKYIGITPKQYVKRLIAYRSNHQ